MLKCARVRPVIPLMLITHIRLGSISLLNSIICLILYHYSQNANCTHDIIDLIMERKLFKQKNEGTKYKYNNTTWN